MRSDLSSLETYGHRDLLDKAALDFFGGEFTDLATLTSTSGEGETGIDQFGDNAGQVLPTTEASLAQGRALLAGLGLQGMPEQSALETGAALAGSATGPKPIGAGDGGSAYAELVASSLEAAGYNAGGVTADEVAAKLGISAEEARSAIGGIGDPALVDAVIAAHSQLLEERNQAVSGTVQAGYL